MLNFLFLLFLSFQSAATITVTPGVYLQRLPNITFYQATKPLLFKFDRPTPGIPSHCHVILCKTYIHLCHVIFNTTTYFDTIVVDNIKHLSENDVLLSDDGETLSFHYATRTHVPRLFTTAYEINLLMKQVATVRQLPFYNLTFHYPFPKLSDSLNCLDPLLIHALMAEQTFFYYWTKSFSDMCQSKKLKLDILPMSELQVALNVIEQEALSHDFFLSLDSLSAYYMLPITECTISKERALVGLHVPLIRRNLHGLSMGRLMTPPFAWNDLTCAATVPNIDVAYSSPTLPNLTILTPHCDPFHEDICLLNQQYDKNALAVSCASQLLMDTTPAQLARVCSFQCQDIGTPTEYITRLEANRYLLTHPHEATAVICNNTKYQIPTLPQIGAIAVSLPCDCRIHGEHLTVTADEVPCLHPETSVTFTTFLPAEWTKLQTVTISPNGESRLRFISFNDCLDEQWLLRNRTTSFLPVSTYLFGLSFVFHFLTLVCLIFLGWRLWHISTELTPASIQRHGQITFRRPASGRFASQLPPPRPTSAFSEAEEYMIPSPVDPQPYTTLTHHYHNRQP